MHELIGGGPVRFACVAWLRAQAWYFQTLNVRLTQMSILNLT